MLEEGKFEKSFLPDDIRHISTEDLEWLADKWRPIVILMKRNVFSEGFPSLEEVKIRKKELVGEGKVFQNEEQWEKFMKMEEHIKECQACTQNFEDVLYKSLR